MLRGAVVALAIAVPAALVSQALTSTDALDSDSNWLVLFVVVVIAAFGIGGWTAARHETPSPLRDGATAAFLAYAVVQTVGVIRLLVAGDEIEWVKIAFNGLLAASVGATGAIFAQRRYVQVSDQ